LLLLGLRFGAVDFFPLRALGGFVLVGRGHSADSSR
jgi:hypothetical protein